MSSRKHIFDIPPGAKITVPDLGSSPKTFDAVDHLREIAQHAGAKPVFRRPDTWEVVVPTAGELLFHLGAKELTEAFGRPTP